jgi:hypothetical protein
LLAGENWQGAAKTEFSRLRSSGGKIYEGKKHEHSIDLKEAEFD